jgi:hypothetical protein
VADSKRVPIETKTGRPEDELLLRCARVSRTPEDNRRIGALLREETDWKYLLRVAREHRVVPLLFSHLNATCPEAVPETVLNELRNYYHESTRRNLFLTGELLKLLNLFEANGIHAIPYKGPTLAAMAYGNLALREFDDLDILVRKQDVPRAEELLVSMEYRSQYRLNGEQQAAFLRNHYEHAFTRGDGEVTVDLHWGIMEKHFSFSLDSECLWGRLERISLGGNTVLTLSPEDLLLILCMHGSKHFWERLSWIRDVAELIRVHKKINWEQFMKQASTLGSERMLLLGLYLASDLLGAALPEEVWRRVHTDPTVKALARQVHERLFREANGSLGAFEGLPLHPFHLRARERLQDKLRYCIYRVTTITMKDSMLLPLPGYLYPLYYIIRPKRLAGKYGKRVIETAFL